MKKYLLITCCFLSILSLQAQKYEAFLSNDFHYAEGSGRYRMITEKKDTLWHRQLWYLPEQILAMECWYKGEDFTVRHGVYKWYHISSQVQTEGVYVDGKKEGVWRQYNEKGRLIDSATYVAGRLRGVRLKWDSDGSLIDSMQFDGAGNGVEVSWYGGGEIYATGNWVADTAKHGRWQYFHKNGNVMATEDYVGGKAATYTCYDETGKQLDSLQCIEQKAEFPGGLSAWGEFLKRHLKPKELYKKGAPQGYYTVMVQFLVDTDGTVTDIIPLTNYGYGMEEQVVRIMKKTPRWIPARKFGKTLKTYRKQPVSFVL